MSISRCRWVTDDPVYINYHDQEWGVPLRGDRRLFELLMLEGAQAGLSWITVLRKRDGYRRAFDDFEPEKMARYGEQEIAQLLANSEIVRNRLKVNAAVTNAKALLAVQKEFGSFDQYVCQEDRAPVAFASGTVLVRAPAANVVALAPRTLEWTIFPPERMDVGLALFSVEKLVQRGEHCHD